MDIQQWRRLPFLDDSFPLSTAHPFTLRSAIDEGLRRPWLVELCRAGLLRNPIKGVYLPSQVVDDTSSRLECLRLVTPADAVVVDRQLSPR